MQTVTDPAAAEGYGFSRFGVNFTHRPAPVFYTDSQHPQDHRFSEEGLVNRVTGQPNASGLAEGGLTAAAVTQARWPAVWNPLELTNGNFDNAATALLPGNTNGLPQPGWFYHAAAGMGGCSCR